MVLHQVKDCGSVKKIKLDLRDNFHMIKLVELYLSGYQMIAMGLLTVVFL
jgi:hypothetical protein